MFIYVSADLRGRWVVQILSAVALCPQIMSAHRCTAADTPAAALTGPMGPHPVFDCLETPQPPGVNDLGYGVLMVYYNGTWGEPQACWQQPTCISCRAPALARHSPACAGFA